MSTQPEKPDVLDYQSPAALPRPSLVIAVLFALPGLAFWCFFFSWLFLDLNRWLRFSGHFLAIVFSLWPLVVATSIWSFFHYGNRWHQPKPWYVILCLALNGLGLLFTMWVIFSR